MTRRALLVALLATGLAVGTAAPGGATGSKAQQIARAGVLVRSDFPSGWKSSTRGQTSDAALDAATAKIDSCQPFLAFSRTNKKYPRAKSPNFDRAQSNVTNSVTVYPSSAKATASIHVLSDARLPDCLQRLYSSVFEQQLATNEHVESVNTSIAPVADVRIGDEAVAYQGTVDVRMQDGTTTTIGLGVVSARVGDALIGYSWTSDADISAPLQTAIVKSVNRLHEAQSDG